MSHPRQARRSPRDRSSQREQAGEETISPLRDPIDRQRTIATSVGCEGVALHSGKRVRLGLQPGEAGSGIVFRRTDGPARGEVIRADWRNVADCRLCTTLANENGYRLSTMEHLMAALYACRIDNALIEVEGDEIPILDGSAAPFVGLLEEAGVREQPEARRHLRVLETVEIREGERVIRLEPAEELSLDLTLVLPGFGRSNWRGAITPEVVRESIAEARTFGHLAQVGLPLILGKLRLIPYLRGASLGSAVVLLNRFVLNRGGLRCDDEPVKHRVLDLVGDLALAGAPLQARVTAATAGHCFNTAILRKLFADETAWEWVEPEVARAPAAAALPS